MENKSAANQSPVLISAGIVAITVITLVVLGFFAVRQMPTEVADANNGAVSAAAAEATATPIAATSAVTETTTVVTDTAGAVVTDTVTAALTSTTTAVTGTTAVTSTAALSKTDAAVTATVPVSAAPAVPAATGAVDMAAVTAAITKGTCGACHTIPGLDIAVGMIGPNLAAVGADAATRIPGYTAEAYIRESILNPNAFIAPKCPTGDCIAGVMLPNLAQLLTPAEIDTIVNYLLTLKGP